MAPENLHLNSEEIKDAKEFIDFSDFILADIYSSGLVIWEILRRTASNLEEDEAEEKKMMMMSSMPVDERQLPYFEYVDSDPKFEEMRDIVCLKVSIFIFY